MTGNVDIRRAGGKEQGASWGGLRLWGEGGRKEGEGTNRRWFVRLLIEGENGAELALTDPRRFGRMWLADAPLLHPRIKKLGFDPLQKFPTAKELALILRKRRAPIKAVLLDQSLFAGVGNWIADEVLFQARLSPHRLAASLTGPEVARLRAKTIAIIKKAVAVHADYDRFPRTWLFHHRWGKKADAEAYGKKKIRHDEVGGRTTAWVPELQK
jgi:formamidopyrimidine-DNA glycosylase